LSVTNKQEDKMKTFVMLAVMVIGCADPLDRVIAVEKKSAKILEGSGGCAETVQVWRDYREGLSKEGLYENAFDYAIDTVKRAGADSSTAKEIEKKFCDFLIAHQESAFWLMKNNCRGMSFYLGMKYDGNNFEKEVRYVNRMLSGMPAGYGTFTRYWTRTCEPRAKEALKALELNK
jgi:hypothetical protein